MESHDLQQLLVDVRQGTVSADAALTVLRRLPFADLEFARIDHHRSLRQGLPEAVYAPGKTREQCAAIVGEMLANGTGPVLLTRADEHQAAFVLGTAPGGRRSPVEPEPGRLATISWRNAQARDDRVVIVTAGTADLPVAQECGATLRAYGYSPSVVVDCGVAGVHRLLANFEEIADADVVVVIAGMEGALASVVGGLTAAPVIAVPTSVGYGTALDGITALLAMHASCAAGITVVGIDNGYGAACAVARMRRRT